MELQTRIFVKYDGKDASKCATRALRGDALITPNSFNTIKISVRTDTMPSPPCFVLLFISAPYFFKISFIIFVNFGGVP